MSADTYAPPRGPNARASRRRPRPTARLWRRLGAAIVAAVAVAVGALVVLQASKPVSLTSIDPADGGTVATAPAEVALDFSGDPTPQQFHLAVAGSDGGSVTSGPATVDGARITVPVRITRRGTYLFAYHVVLADGHELSGQTRFTVTTDTPATGPPPKTTAAPDPLDHSAHGIDGFGLVLLTIDVGLTAVLAVFMVRRRRSR